LHTNRTKSNSAFQQLIAIRWSPTDPTCFDLLRICSATCCTTSQEL